MIELSIYEKVSKKSLIIYIGIGILITLALYLLFPKYSPLFFILPVLIFLFIISITEPKAKPAGTIYLTERQILIKTNHTDIKSELSGISKLKLKYSGFKGKRLPGDFFPRFNQFSGNDNYISIDLGTEVYEYRFLVENEIKEKQIIELISDWEKIGFDVSNISLNI
jgi:hypothetical protein